MLSLYDWYWIRATTLHAGAETRAKTTTYGCGEFHCASQPIGKLTQMGHDAVSSVFEAEGDFHSSQASTLM